MRINRALLAIALAIPLVGTAVAGSTGMAYKYVCGKDAVAMFSTGTLITLNKNKMDEIRWDEGTEQGVAYKAIMFREYMAAGGSSMRYELKMVDGDAALYQQFVDADDQPKGPLRAEPCNTPLEVQEPIPGPSMGEIRASEG